MSRRKEDFEKIAATLCENNYEFLKDEGHILVKGDSLDVLKNLPSHSISLIITDPPYHVTKKKNIHGDTSFESDESYLAWLDEYFTEWQRILKPNGALYVFCDSKMSARIEVSLSKKFNILSHIVWTKPNEPGYDGWKGKMKKESLRQWYGHSERIIFAEPSHGNNLFKSYFGNLLKELRTQSGLSGHKLTELVGAYGKVNHGGAVSNWEAGRNTPSREQYEKIKKALLNTGKVSSVPDFEDAVRPFFANGEIQYTDVWHFPSVKQYKGKHPAEKPLDMLKHMITSSSYEEDIVLDCFAGSGNTAIASKEVGRKSIVIEIKEELFENISRKLFGEEV